MYWTDLWLEFFDENHINYEIYDESSPDAYDVIEAKKQRYRDMKRMQYQPLNPHMHAHREEYGNTEETRETFHQPVNRQTQNQGRWDGRPNRQNTRRAPSQPSPGQTNTMTMDQYNKMTEEQKRKMAPPPQAPPPTRTYYTGKGAKNRFKEFRDNTTGTGPQNGPQADLDAMIKKRLDNPTNQQGKKK
jgi:hypothetical protein